MPLGGFFLNEYYQGVVVFIFGLIVGSFLNVCIYRIPLNLSIVFPSSRCTSCGNDLRWRHNVPVVSYLILHGKCAFCGCEISMRYPLVEIANGGLYALIYYMYGFSFSLLFVFLFVSLLLVVSFIDFDHQIVPDVVTLPGIVVGFLSSFFVPWLTWQDSVVGILLGGGALLLVAFVYEFLTKQEGMGGGDIKLLAMIGAFCGWKAVLPVIFISSLLGSLVGIPLMVFQKKGSKMVLPFGPFLAVAALIYLFFGQLLIQCYFELFL